MCASPARLLAALARDVPDDERLDEPTWARLLEVVEMLASKGTEVVALKGSSHAHLLYDEPGLRYFGDVDVLVPSGRTMDAVAVLERERGATRQVPEVRAGFDRRFSKGVTLEGPVGTELDIHRNLLFGTFGPKVRASLPYCPSRGEAASFLWVSAVPSPAFLRRRAAGRADWLRRGLRRRRRR